VCLAGIVDPFPPLIASPPLLSVFPADHNRTPMHPWGTFNGSLVSPPFYGTGKWRTTSSFFRYAKKILMKRNPPDSLFSLLGSFLWIRFPPALDYFDTRLSRKLGGLPPSFPPPPSLCLLTEPRVGACTTNYETPSSAPSDIPLCFELDPILLKEVVSFKVVRFFPFPFHVTPLAFSKWERCCCA